MLLSIVMMMKNEEKYLDKTLSALNTFMKELNSELIILDTGSTDSSVEICKKYTNNIYFAEWNNNFSDMRNKSIAYAKGDWILIIDADEELINYDKLIEFFKTDLHKEYNSASIELNNMLSKDMNSYAKASIIRLFKNDNFRYEGAIHEQPLYKYPVYNDIATFNHYGYIFEDEEFKQKKLKRNEEILFLELKSKPNDPYINYQLAKNFSAFGNNEEAIYYIEKSFELYKKQKSLPPYVQSNMARIYINASKYDKCEKVCLEYIKTDKKNIDIYYYLALSQNLLKKYKQSLVNFDKYIYLVDNYEESSQAKNLLCDGNTVALREKVDIIIVKIYYELEMYEEVIDRIKNMKYKSIKSIQKIIIMSLYKLNRVKDILKLYNESSKSQIENKSFKLNLEKVLINIKKDDRYEIYKALATLDDNYGILNKIRLNENIETKKYKEILLREDDIYYGDIVYYAFMKNIDIVELLKDNSYIKINDYINYIIVNRPECTVVLYEYLLKSKNTLDLKTLSLYSCLSIALLFNAKLSDDKYNKLFSMYIMYKYYYLTQIYNQNLTQDELINFIVNKEDKFIIELIKINDTREINKIEYIRSVKNLLLRNKHHKKGIEILIDKFEKEINISKQLKELQNQYKMMIKNDINTGNIIAAKNKISEYEEIFDEEIDILNIKSIIALLENKYDEAEKLLKRTLMIDINNYDAIFNIAYLKESIGELDEATRFYNRIIEYCKDEEIVLEAREKIDLIKNNKQCIQGA